MHIAELLDRDNQDANALAHCRDCIDNLLSNPVYRFQNQRHFHLLEIAKVGDLRSTAFVI